MKERALIDFARHCEKCWHESGKVDLFEAETLVQFCVEALSFVDDQLRKILFLIIEDFRNGRWDACIAVKWPRMILGGTK